MEYPCKHGAQVFCGSCETAKDSPMDESRKKARAVAKSTTAASFRLERGQTHDYRLGGMMDDQVKWLASLLHGYEHYPETFGEDWPNVLAESLACHLWPEKSTESIFRSGGQTSTGHARVSPQHGPT